MAECNAKLQIAENDLKVIREDHNLATSRVEKINKAR
jgi:hypothetical protein